MSKVFKVGDRVQFIREGELITGKITHICEANYPVAVVSYHDPDSDDLVKIKIMFSDLVAVAENATESAPDPTAEKNVTITREAYSEAVLRVVKKLERKNAHEATICALIGSAIGCELFSEDPQ